MPNALAKAHRHAALFADVLEPQADAAAPTASATKAEILAWLAAHDIDASDHMTKAELLELARS